MEPEPPLFSFTPRPRRRTGVVVAAVLIVVGSLSAGYGLGLTIIDANGAASGPVDQGVAAATTVGGLLTVVVGAVSWLFMIQRFPRSLSSWHCGGVLLLCAGVGFGRAWLELGVDGWYLLVAVGLAVAGTLGVGGDDVGVVDEHQDRGAGVCAADAEVA